MKHTRMLIVATALSMTTLLAGCPSVPTTSEQAATSPALAVPKNPQQAVYAMKHSLLAALSLVEDYKGLPACAGSALICKSASVESQLRSLSNAAAAALDEAEKAVRTPGFAEDKFVTVQASALAAINSLTLATSAIRLR